MEVATVQDSVDPKADLWLPPPMETRPVRTGEIPCQLCHELSINWGRQRESSLFCICHCHYHNTALQAVYCVFHNRSKKECIFFDIANVPYRGIAAFIQKPDVAFMK
jgi:hypothetical protein